MNTKNIRVISFSLIIATSLLQAQTFMQEKAFDDFVNQSISISEKLLYRADFDEAQKYLRLSFFESFALYQTKHQIALISQDSKVQIIKNRIYQKESNQKAVLKRLLNLNSSAGKLQDKAVYADYLFTLGMSYLYNSNSDSAGLYYNDALKVFEELGNDYSAANVRAWLIWVKRNHAYPDAKKIIALIPEYQKEIAFAAKANNKLALAYNTRHLANIYFYRVKDLDKALELYEESLSLREDIGFRPYIPASHSSVGDVFSQKGDYQKAIDKYLRSIETAEEISFLRFQFHPRIKIGDIYLKQQDHETAKKFYTEALKFASASGYLPGIDEALNKLDSLKK